MTTKLPPKPTKKKRFGALPDNASNTLEQPEHAPVAPTDTKSRTARKKTGRTVAFGTRVSQDFRDEFDRIAYEDKMKNVELLEAMLEAYKSQR